MKTTKYSMLIVSLLLALNIDNSYAQEADPTVSNTVVFIQNSTLLIDQAAVFSAFDQYERPVWNSLVKDGKIMGYGHLTHSWGDDWNVNYYFHTDDQAQFNATWSEYFAELRQKHPEQLRRLIELTQDHKDNLYFERISQ